MLRGVVDPAVLLGLVHARHAQRKGDVLAHRHVRIKRVGLEHHRQAALGGRQCRVASLPSMLICPPDDILEPGDQAQKRGLAAARGADEHDELALLDGQVQRRNDLARHRSSW